MTPVDRYRHLLRLLRRGIVADRARVRYVLIRLMWTLRREGFDLVALAEGV